jgi:toxin ParE1/3/4
VKPHVFHPEADAEYADAAQYYAGCGADLGGRFYDEIERVIAEIDNAPHRFRLYDPPARRHLARDFPYAVVYLDEPERVWIVAVMPLRREPDYWKHRLG